MACPRFFCEQITGSRVRLEGDEAHHARASRRLRVGDAVVVFDGRGTEANGRIAAIERGSLEVAIEHVEHRPPLAPVAVVVATAMPKGPRQDYLIEKCTELGVAAIWPMLTRRCTVRPAASRLAKWRRTSIEAAKQSQRPWLPEILPAAPFDEVLARARQCDLAVLAVPTGANPLGRVAASARSAERVAILIGPEGGFAPDECEQARQAGLRFASLGRTILRTETAAVAAAAVVLAVMEHEQASDG